MAQRVMAERVAAAAAKRLKRRLFLGGWPRRFIKEQPLGAFGGVVLLALVLVSIFAGPLAGHDPNQMTLADRLQGPSGEYPLGTDQLGRDYLSRLIYGARISLFVGLAATTLHLVVAVLIGGTAGFIGGKLDLLVQRFVDAWMSFPGLLLLLTIMSITGQGLLQIIVILGVSSGIANSRVVRGAVIGIKENDCFQAARVIGERTFGTLLRHVTERPCLLIGSSPSRIRRSTTEESRYATKPHHAPRPDTATDRARSGASVSGRHRAFAVPAPREPLPEPAREAPPAWCDREP